MATGESNTISSVKSDLASISRSVSEGNMKGQPSSPIYKGSKGGDGGMKGGKKNKKY